MVCGKRYFPLGVLAVFVLIARQSSANDISSCINEFDSELSNGKYRMMHENAFRAIEEVNKKAYVAEQKVSTENKKNAIKRSQIGCVESIQCVAVAVNKVYEANQEVRESCDAEGSKQKLNNVNKDAKKDIAAAGIAAYLGIAEAIEMAGVYSGKPLRESLKHVTKAGQISYSGLDVSNQLGILGLGSGEAAKEQGLNASSKAVELTGAACYHNLVKAASIAFAGIDNSKPATLDDMSLESAEKSSETSSNIESVKKAAESASKMSNRSTKEAVDVVKTFIIAAMRHFSEAMQKPQEILNAAQETEDTKESLQTALWKEMKQTEDKIANAAAFAYQGLGMAAQKVGGKRAVELAKDMSEVEAARFAAYNALQDASFLALQGLENGKTAMRSGINAANDALLAGLFVALAHLNNAANVAFNILRL